MSPKALDLIEIALVTLTGYACHLYYNLIGHIASLRGVDAGPHLLTAVDRAIPYMPFWVNFYQLAYFMPGVVLALVFARNGLDVPAVRRILVAFLSLLFAHYGLYLAVPASAAAVRLPDAALGAGTLGGLVRYQYALATIWCAWPSLHVSACWFFFRLLATHYRRLRWIYLGWFVGMVVGTAAIKIHYVLDAATGLVLGECAFRFVLAPLTRRNALARRSGSQPRRILVHLAVLVFLLAFLRAGMRMSGYRGPLYTIGFSSPTRT